MRGLADFFKTLSDEARLIILWLLFQRRELCVCDILAVLDVTQSKASRHLAALRHAGLIAGRKEGLWSYSTLAPFKDRLVRAQLKTLRNQLALRPEGATLLARLNDFLRAEERKAVCPLPEPGRAGRNISPPGRARISRRRKQS